MHTVLLCLHGWGGSKESFTELREALNNPEHLTILTPDLPGFGNEAEPDRAWTVDDYAHWVEGYLKSQQANQPISQLLLLGHSHGGRIAIKLATRGSLQIDQLILCAAAGIRHPRHFKRIIGLTLAKAGKFFLSIPGLKQLQPIGKKLLYKLVRVHDYEKASSVMRQTLIEVSQEDLRPLLSEITQPTHIFWGENDGMTPIGDAHVMHAEIEGSTLQTFPNVRHRVHRDCATDIAKVLLNLTER